MSGCNGWRNRETWLVNVWFNPESLTDLDYAKEYLEDQVDQLPGVLRDFIDLGAIDWRELRDHVRHELEQEEE